LHAAIIELQWRLLARERKLDSREGAIIRWDEGLVAFARALGVVHVKRDTSHTCADAVQ
jgi:hypothetical protein